MTESRKARAGRASRIAATLAGWYPDDVRCALTWRTPFELLVKTILSAQATDVKVNEVAPALFARYPDAAALAAAEPGDVEPLIHATGFFRAKARSVVACSRALVERHGGQVPRTMEPLTALPGVGRKTANVVLTECFGVPGIVVDTHVLRVSGRLGLASGDDAERVEADLGALLPEPAWSDFCHRLTYLGRRVCDARKPKCLECRLRPDCPTGKAVKG
jgi:endonuclease III